MQLRVEFKGLSEISRAMRELPKRIDRKILDDGLLAGANIVRDQARALAPVLMHPDPRWRPGALKRAIQSARLTASQTQYAAEVIVHVRKLSAQQIGAFKRRAAKRKRPANGRLNPDDPFYWFFVEFGAAGRPAQPFLRPAFESRKQQAVDAAIKIFSDRVQLEIAKLSRTTI